MAPLRELGTWLLYAIFVKVLLVAFSEEIRNVADYFAKEVRAVLRMTPTLKALNAYGLGALLVVLLSAGFVGFSTMPAGSPITTAYDIALLETGARVFYVLMFTVGLLGCLLLTALSATNQALARAHR